MAHLKSSRAFLAIPPGFQSIPLDPKAVGTALRLSIIARTTPDPVAGSLVLLREVEDASVYLGCVADAAGRVQEWIEIWVQTPENVAGCPSGYKERLSNDLLDQKWKQQVSSFQELAPEDTLTTGWESVHPAPLCLDPRNASPVPVADSESGKPWTLCQDDHVLSGAGLPSYSHSMARYLYQADVQPPRFVRVTKDAPETDATLPLSKAITDGDQLIPFNPHAGLILARRLSPIPLDAYADLLSSKPWQGLGYGKTPVPLGEVYEPLRETTPLEEAGAYLFTGPQGLASRLVETFHLKLQLFTEALRLVRSFVQHQQLPFLNLSPDSFRVKLQATGGGLPYLWTARVALAKPSQALALPIEAGDFRYFLPGKNPHPFIYLPEGSGQTSRGEGSVRVREVQAPGDGRYVVEGTLISKEKISISPHDLLWMNLPLESGRTHLYGHLYAADGMAEGEARFRTLPLELSESTRNALNAAAGTALSRIPFEVVPLLSTPCDLYSLGVLFVRLLLVNEDNTLPIALDETLSLARQAGGQDQSVELKERIRALFEGDSRWQTSLGPHRLRYPKTDPVETGQLIPLELWYEVLAELVRFFPGLGPESICKDYGDAPALALETIFDQPLRNLENLLLRTRSLIVLDWTFNREIHTVIERFLSNTNPGPT